MQYLAVLGRQPEISLAELSAQFRGAKQKNDNVALFFADREPDIDRLGGSLKLAKRLKSSPKEYLESLPEGKITLGVSDYSSRGASARRANGEALKLKKALKRAGRSVRVLPNSDPAISTAAAHHNSLGKKPRAVELMLVDGEWFTSLGAQNITAYARRDQARPARDAKVGMLPPKLAQILINLCGPLKPGSRLLDPFCGTGVLLQEAYLLGLVPYGTDLSERMVEYSERNLRWLADKEKFASQRPVGARQRETERGSPMAMGRADASARSDFSLSAGNAVFFRWTPPIDAVACETYLGPPMSTPPAEIKLKAVKQECGSIILGFLKNIAPQIAENTPLTLAVPAWLRPDGSYSRLNILDEIENLGYNVEKKLGASPLLYFRTGQVVAREILILRKK